MFFKDWIFEHRLLPFSGCKCLVKTKHKPWSSVGGACWAASWLQWLPFQKQTCNWKISIGPLGNAYISYIQYHTVLQISKKRFLEAISNGQIHYLYFTCRILIADPCKMNKSVSWVWVSKRCISRAFVRSHSISISSDEYQWSTLMVTGRTWLLVNRRGRHQEKDKMEPKDWGLVWWFSFSRW